MTNSKSSMDEKPEKGHDRAEPDKSDDDEARHKKNYDQWVEARWKGVVSDDSLQSRA